MSGAATWTARLALLADTPRGMPFFGQIKMWETHGSYRKIVEKHDSHDTWLTFIGFPHLC